MGKNRRRSAFTLIEVLIVVIIMAVLAATIIPQFSSSTKDAKESSLKFNLQTLRSQIERYKFDHNGTPPTAAGFVDQMTKCTKVDGTDPVATADATHPYGPYMQSVPANSFNGQTGVVGCTGVPTAESGPTTNGWQYDAAAGRIYANTTGYFSL
jgi:prepilin-type N-terminal cleavage/methylation domain-containing protein